MWWTAPVRTLPTDAPDRSDDAGREGRAESPTWTVLGRTIGVPVEVRTARQWSVQYLVPAAAAQRLIAPTGLEVTGPVPGRALVALAICRYLDTDLDPYHEVAVSFVVRRHDAPAKPSLFDRLSEFARGDLGAYIHRLPVDHAFTCAAGRDIWGFPKWVTTIDIDEPAPGDRHSGVTARLVDGSRHVLSLTIFSGGRLGLPSQAPPTYSFDGQVLRRTSWSTKTKGVSGRPGGARLVLGEHPMADELRSLGLPKRALFSSSARQMSASFSAPEVVAIPDR
jgi:Acetoacetate decarboxylase (ADC)